MTRVSQHTCVFGNIAIDLRKGFDKHDGYSIFILSMSMYLARQCRLSFSSQRRYGLCCALRMLRCEMKARSS